MDLNIKNIKGDVIASDNQQSGVAGKINVENSFYKKYKKPIIITVILVVVGAVSFIANLINISDFIKTYILK